MSEELDSTKAELHSFLDQDVESSRTSPPTAEPETQEPLTEDLDPAHPEEETLADAYEEEDEADYEAQESYETIADLPRHQRRQLAVNPPKMPLVIGMLLVMVAMALGAWEVTNKGQTGALSLLQQFGINPAILLVSGILLTTLALAQRGVMQSSTHKLLLAFEQEQSKVHHELHTLLNEKLSDQHDFSATNEAEAFEKLAMMFRKIESMLANLTKATRLLNKPIVDLHSQVADIQDPLEQMRAGIGEIHGDFELLTKSQTEAAVNFEKKWESQMQRQLMETQELLDKYEQVKRELLNNLDHRLDDLDKHVERLDGDRGFQEELQEFSQKLEKDLEEKLGKNIDQLSEKVAQLGQQGGDDPSEKVISELQDGMDRILSAVEEISSRPVAAAAASSSGTSSKPAKAKSSKSTAKSKSSSGGKAQGEKQGGKKVLSAIEKLKQLRGS